MNNQTLRAALRANIQLSDSSEASLGGFLDEYFGVAHDTPFGGRERELQALDEWFGQSKHNFALVVSEAGKGKSALLTQWAARLATRGCRKSYLVFAGCSFAQAPNLQLSRRISPEPLIQIQNL